MGADLKKRVLSRLALEHSEVAFKRTTGLRFALAFPNVYRVGIASLGLQLVYKMLNDLPEVSCERVFLPDPSDFKEHIRTSTELFTLETQSPLADFDAIGFSVAFEMDYLNILRMLRMANLPIRSTERNERHPIVIAGGPCVTFNPEPLAEFIDAFVIGDAEEVLPLLIECIQSHRDDAREMLLSALAELPGVYVPSVPGQVTRMVCRGLHNYPLQSCITTTEGEFGAIELIEIARGCGRGCRFCVTGWVNHPPRNRILPERLSEKRIGLVGAAVFDHPGSLDLCRRIVESGRELTVSSIRLETVTPEVTRLLVAGGQRTLTIAPEAGTERLRRVIGKYCTDEQIYTAIATAHNSGIEKVKLYFMIGLPTETEKDVESIVELLRTLTAKCQGIELQVSVSSFVPKPWTPFQWHPMERESVLKKRYAKLSKEVTAIRGVKFSGESPRLSVIQGLLARGDRRVGQLIEAALENNGDYRTALRQAAVDLEYYLYRPRSKYEVFPWDHIDMGIDKNILWRHYEQALNEVGPQV